MAAEDIRQGRRRVVLLADDDQLVRTMASDALAESGVPLEVVACADGVKALALVRAMRDQGRPLDLLVLDIVMEVMSGLDVARAVRTEEVERDSAPVPIVFITGLDASDPRLQEALHECQPALLIDKRTCADGVEIGRRLASAAQGCFAIQPS